MAQILIIEDDPKMQSGLKDNLELDGYNVDVASDGEEGFMRATQNTYDLILLDVMLPKISGFDVLKKIREQGVGTPVIMLTAKSEEIDKVLGLELGADDYITKPFSLRELLARVKVVLRRNETAGSAQQELKKVTIGKLEIDFSSYNATRNKKPVDMTPKEFEILKFLWQHRNQTVSRDQLLTNVWGYDESISSRTVDNFILKLRQKIEDKPETPKHILTIHGIGYKLIYL
ncbi:MAG: response regulator transcription factor [Bacteroidetes bacterium]|nr:MAG: response regulator transcription factor [Bacteroidota bacterium]